MKNIVVAVYDPEIVSLSMNFFRFSVILLVLLLLTGMARAEVYQYFDEEGTLVVTIRGQKTPKPPHHYHKDEGVQIAYRNDVSYDYYPVFAGDFKTAIDYVNANGPFDAKEGKRYAAQTRWTLGWRYKFDSSFRIDGDSVVVVLNIFDVEFLPDITVLIPELAPGVSLDDNDWMLWDRFLQGLLDHEHDHVRITQDPSVRADAVRRISELRSLTLVLDPREDINAQIKKSVETETSRIGHDLIMKIKDRNEEYDRITNHGMRPEMRNSFFGG